MKQFANTYTIIVFVSLVLTGCNVSSPKIHSVHNSKHDHTHDDADSILHTHETLPDLSTWCDDCNVGFVAGQQISSKLLFETLDAHGHDVNVDAMICSSCLTALPVSGYCETHRIGFVDSKAYFSRLTYSLAKGGEARDVSSLTCTTCRTNAQDHGWCDSCQIGLVGNVAFTNRKEYANAVEQFLILKSAIDKTGDCEMCACAMVVDRRCPKCKISYQNGLPIGGP